MDPVLVGPAFVKAVSTPSPYGIMATTGDPPSYTIGPPPRFVVRVPVNPVSIGARACERSEDAASYKES